MAVSILGDLRSLLLNQDVSKMVKLLTLCQSGRRLVLKVFVCVVIVLRLSLTFS